MPRKKKIVSWQWVDRVAPDGKPFKERVKVRTQREFTVEEEAARDAEELSFATGIAREEAKERVLAHAVSLVTGDFPSVTCAADMSTIRVLNTALPGNSGSKELRDAIARDEYAKAKLLEIDGYDRATAEAYDPATDGGWP